MQGTRRSFIGAMGLALSGAPFRILNAQTEDASSGNFSYVYSDPARREEFKQFLANVFRLYPEDALHGAIASATDRNRVDRQIYLDLQLQLDGLKPFLGDFRYALPTLAKQKKVLAEQTVELLGDVGRIDGYLEVGSTGRFLDPLEEEIEIRGDRFFLADLVPGHGPFDVIDRGQFPLAGEFVRLNGYRPELAAYIPPQSVDLATVYIGFHHCPVDLREEFLDGLRATLRPGGALIVRDHDVRDEHFRRLVALAHDVFNMGTRETWATNERELRNFYPLAELDVMLRRAGFAADGRPPLYQDGDPTRNALMLYRKV